MASKYGSKSKKLGSSSSKAANSPASSTTTSSKQYLETSIECQSSPATSSARSKQQYLYSESLPQDGERSKENVTVTVRFRPLSPREIRQGEEIAWYADGDTIVRNEHNPSIAYAYDRVFGPTTTTRHVYDVAAQHVISGAMEGVNGTIFAYGVTSSGKTHTMHGDQRSPGIIPLAVKDAFSIIQETPNREYLLRVSYLEIYNEVVNDLLNPAGQNLRIREDAQGTFVEGIKEEVVLSPAHALSLIAAGEEHRHVGSTNFNLLSSRSHTIFSLTIESSPCGENCEGEAVSLSQLNLIDLAGSESSKAETTGVRRKEGSYINKSLLTLGTVISKLTDTRATHIPYRDSKLTRLLQSSLSGHGRVSLICTVTPSSSSSEETHNTLKFAHRAKHIEIQAAQNKIIDEKSLIKKYQNEIRSLKEELEQLKRGIVTIPQLKDAGEDDILLLKQKVHPNSSNGLVSGLFLGLQIFDEIKPELNAKTLLKLVQSQRNLSVMDNPIYLSLEDGKYKLQSRLEQEEEAKAALLGRIQRLTKLILVSTKETHPSRFSHRPGVRRRHSFGEEELAYLPYKRRDLILDDESIELFVPPLDGSTETTDDILKGEKKTRKHGLLNWLKIRKRDGGTGTLTSTSDKSSGITTSAPSTPQTESGNFHAESRLSHSALTESFPSAESEAREDREVLQENFLGQETPLTSMKSIDQIDLLREQQKILSDEVALHLSALKRLSEEASRHSEKDEIRMEMRKLKDEIKAKKEQIALVEKKIGESFSHNKMGQLEASQSIAEVMEQLNEKSFELEVKAADNRIIQEQLEQKIGECKGLQETVASLKQQLSEALEFKNLSPIVTSRTGSKNLHEELCTEKDNEVLDDKNEVFLLRKQVEELKQKVVELTESKERLEVRNQKLVEESSYAKGLASAAAVELKALSEEVSKLMNQNEKLAAELAASKNSPTQRRNSSTLRNGRRESHTKQDQSGLVSEMKRELAVSKEREHSYEAALTEKDKREAELQRRVEESKQREAYLENELANMWVLVAKLKKSHGTETDSSDSTKETRHTDGYGAW